MESNSRADETRPHDGSPGEAARLLNDLATDRAALAERLAAPQWLYPAAGLVAALYVATPVIEADMARRIVAGLAIGSTALLVWGYQRATGVKVSRAGASAQMTLAAQVVVILLLLSVSFALASFGLYWWIVIPTAASFVLTLSLGKRFHRQYRDHMLNGR